MNTKQKCYIFLFLSGAKSGLKLILNIEQYEYMPGPHEAAGVKILLHEPGEFPFISELGKALQIGTHTFVGVQMLKVSFTNHLSSVVAKDMLHLYFSVSVFFKARILVKMSSFMFYFTSSSLCLTQQYKMCYAYSHQNQINVYIKRSLVDKQNTVE